MEKRKYEDDITSYDDFQTSDISKKIDINKVKQTLEDEKNITPQTNNNVVKEEVQENNQEEVKLDEMYENDPIISLKNVGLKYGSETILKGINIDVQPGEFVYLVGESGAGKSSIAKMLYKEIKNDEGDVFIQGENITKYKPRQLPKLRRKIGVIFQDYKLLPDKTIYQNVAYSLEVTEYPRNKIKDKVLNVLKKVGIEGQAQKYPDELSGGQQQRAAIARAIVDNPIILVADEPTGNLDPENALTIMELLEEINKDGTTIVMATHDVGIVNNFLNRVILLGDGKVLKEAQGEYIYE